MMLTRQELAHGQMHAHGIQQPVLVVPVVQRRRQMPSVVCLAKR